MADISHKFFGVILQIADKFITPRWYGIKITGEPLKTIFAESLIKSLATFNSVSLKEPLYST